MSPVPPSENALPNPSSMVSIERAVPALSGPPVETVAGVSTDVPLPLRAAEFAVSLFALIFFAPLMLLIALVIKWDTPGPALFFQQRVGKDMKPFKFVKFRTLYADARERFPGMYAYRYSDEEIAALRFKVEDDPRVTPQGRFLRRSSLDELPNFWNVLTGQMALVGPRPEIPEMLRYYPEEWRRKFLVRPGITGLAQTSGRGRLSFHETVRYDLEYVRTRTLRMDLRLILRTVWLILVKDGAF